MSNLTVFTDGGARGNPGPAAIGFIITTESGETLIELSRRIGQSTNNIAEYRAVIEALSWLKENKDKIDKVNKIQFFLDSKLVVNQLNGFFKVKDTKLRVLLVQIRVLESEIDEIITYTAIPREKNRKADFLVNRALDNLT